MLDCVEGIDEVEGFIAKMIMDTMEEFISDDNDNRQADENVLNKVNLVNDKAKELYDCFMRKVTVKEVADELKITEDEVIEAIKFSVNNIEYIDYSENE
jgi:RNA polymerase primary sigma factor